MKNTFIKLLPILSALIAIPCSAQTVDVGYLIAQNQSTYHWDDLEAVFAAGYVGYGDTGSSGYVVPETVFSSTNPSGTILYGTNVSQSPSSPIEGTNDLYFQAYDYEENTDTDVYYDSFGFDITGSITESYYYYYSIDGSGNINLNYQLKWSGDLTGALPPFGTIEPDTYYNYDSGEGENSAPTGLNVTNLSGYGGGEE